MTQFASVPCVRLAHDLAGAGDRQQAGYRRRGG
jgi:hypothetical protein